MKPENLALLIIGLAVGGIVGIETTWQLGVAAYLMYMGCSRRA